MVVGKIKPSTAFLRIRLTLRTMVLHRNGIARFLSALPLNLETIGAFQPRRIHKKRLFGQSMSSVTTGIAMVCDEYVSPRRRQRRERSSVFWHLRKNRRGFLG